MGAEESAVQYNNVFSHNKGTCRSCSRSPKKLQETALRSLGACRIVDRRPDGCLIVEAEGKRYFVDYEGRVFREISIRELRKYYVHSSPKSATKKEKIKGRGLQSTNPL